MRSVDTASAYGAPRRFATEDFGHTGHADKTALLHIDGNDALEAVRDDIAPTAVLRRRSETGGR